MSLFGMPDGEPESMRVDPKIGPFDFSGEEDLLALNDRVIELHHQIVERVNRVNAWVDEQGCESLLEKRVQAAGKAAATYGAEKALKNMLGIEQMPYEEFIAKQDPILVSQQAIGLAEGYNNVLQHLHRVEAMLGADEAVKAQVHRTAVEVAKTIMLNMMAYDALMGRFIDRVEHGVPEWDPETGTEKELEEGIPVFGGSSVVKPVEEAKAEDDKVAARLLNGLLF